MLTYSKGDKVGENDARIVLDDSLEDGVWRSEKDFITKVPVIFVAQDIFDKVEGGLTPDAILDEMKKNCNGGSHI